MEFRLKTLEITESAAGIVAVFHHKFSEVFLFSCMRCEFKVPIWKPDVKTETWKLRMKSSRVGFVYIFYNLSKQGSQQCGGKIKNIFTYLPTPYNTVKYECFFTI